jgi:small subunit ribosomal protein S17
MAEAKTKKTPAKAAPKTATPTVTVSEGKLHRRSMVGIVLSDKMNKTRVIRVERQVKQGMYGKYITKSSKFKAHDEENRSKAGDLVNIVESRPLSREKRWAVQKIIRTASGEVLVKG